jgi:hypothetical protein
LLVTHLLPMVLAAWLPVACGGKGDAGGGSTDSGLPGLGGNAGPGAGTGGSPGGGSGGEAPSPGTGADAGTSADAGPSAPHPSKMSVALFDEESIVDFHVTFPPGEYDKLLTLRGPNETRWVVCTFRALDTPAVEARCRRKGSLEDWANEKKPQFVVKFNHIDKQARFRGLRRFNLEAFDGAAAPIRDRVGMWLMREAGLDAPRVNHVRVFKDGTYLGLYQNIESEDKEFLEDHFGADSGGNLWEEGEDLKTNETKPLPSQLPALHDLVDQEPLAGDHAAFYAKLDALVDIEQILREMAGETALLADDNFANGSTNFAFYEHPQRGIMVLPWDFDSILTAPADADLYGYLGVSTEANKLRLLMNQNPAWKQRYDDALVEMRDQHLARVPAKVDAICAQIAAAVKEDANKPASFEDFQEDCAAVKAAASARVAAMKTMMGR